RGGARQLTHRASPLPPLQPARRRAPQVPRHGAQPSDRLLLLVVGAAPPRSARPVYRLADRDTQSQPPLRRVPDALLDLALGSRSAPRVAPARAHERAALDRLGEGL